MMVPSRMPTTAMKRLNGVMATEKPRSEVLEAHRVSSPSQASSGPLGIGTRNHRSKTTKVTTGMPTASATTARHEWRPIQRM